MSSISLLQKKDRGFEPRFIFAQHLSDSRTMNALAEPGTAQRQESEGAVSAKREMEIFPRSYATKSGATEKLCPHFEAELRSTQNKQNNC